MSIPGPLQAYLLNVTLRYGWRKGMLVILAPLIVDGPIIVLSVFFLGQLPDIAVQAISVVGGLLLLYIAWGAWKQLQAGATFDVDEDDDKLKASSSPLRILGTASAMNIFSPGPYLFWTTINGPLLLLGIETAGVVGALAMLVSFYGTFLGGLAILVLLFSRLGKIDQRLTRVILLITIALLVWFGTSLIAAAFGLDAIHRTLSMLALGVIAGYVLYRQVLAPDTT